MVITIIIDKAIKQNPQILNDQVHCNKQESNKIKLNTGKKILSINLYKFAKNSMLIYDKMSIQSEIRKIKLEHQK